MHVSDGDVTCNGIMHCTGKIIKNIFKRGEILLQNEILQFVIKLNQSSEIAFDS